jgi:hypothetical protein
MIKYHKKLRLILFLKDGNLVITYESRNYWSAELGLSPSRNRTMKLLDFEKPVLIDDNHG